MVQDSSELGFKALQGDGGPTSVGVVVRQFFLCPVAGVREGAEDVCFSEKFGFRCLFGLRQGLSKGGHLYRYSPFSCGSGDIGVVDVR